MNNKIINIVILFITYLISLLDRFERDDTKLIKSFNIDGIKIKTDTG